MTNLLVRLFSRSVTIRTQTIKMAITSMHILLINISAIFGTFIKPVLVIRPIFRPAGMVKIGQKSIYRHFSLDSYNYVECINMSWIYSNYEFSPCGFKVLYACVVWFPKICTVPAITDLFLQSMEWKDDNYKQLFLLTNPKLSSVFSFFRI